MIQNPDNSNKKLCSKCQTYFGNEHSNCPFCGSSEVQESRKASGPTQADLKLFQLLKNLNDSQKEAVIRFIENNF